MYNFRTDLALERNELVKKKDKLENVEGIETEENNVLIITVFDLKQLNKT